MTLRLFDIAGEIVDKPMAKFLIVIVSSFLVVAIAILSVQNAAPVSLRFLAFRSVALPFGLWLGFGLAAGMIGTAGLLSVFGKRR